MGQKHILKLTDTEAVLKCYVTDSNGGNVDIQIQTDLTASGQTFTNTNVDVTISEIFWGLAHNKRLDVTRLITVANNEVHGHYYLIQAGTYIFNGFVDDVYSNKDIRLVFDGPGHCILKLRKTSGWTR